jgi:hypothetical protein
MQKRQHGKKSNKTMKTNNLFYNLVFVTSAISAVTLASPSLKKLVTEHKWSGEDTWVVIAALSGTTATSWVRYIDKDGLLHTPHGLPGRDPVSTVETIATAIPEVAAIVSNPVESIIDAVEDTLSEFLKNQKI